MGASERIAQLVTPADHFAALASEQRSDHLLWLKGRKQSNGREWYSLNREIALQELSRYTSQPDVYVTPNEFHGWRLVRLLSGLNAFYVDIDVHDGAGCPVAAAAAALERIDRARLPGPSMVVYTGRGAHLYWCFNRTPAAALPRWQRVQRTLVALTAGDKQVVDVTRVLRVVGTTNPLAAEGRKSVTGEVLNPGRYDFDWLCDQIVELPRAEIRDIRAARANKDAQARAESRAAGRGQGSRKHLPGLVSPLHRPHQDRRCPLVRGRAPRPPQLDALHDGHVAQLVHPIRGVKRRDPGCRQTPHAVLQ